MFNKNKVLELQYRYHMLIDIRYFALITETHTMQTQTKFTLLFGLKDTEVTVEPLINKFQCKSPREIIRHLNYYNNKQSHLIPDVEKINHEFDSVISIDWLRIWLGKLKNYKMSHPSRSFEYRFRYDAVVADIMRVLNDKDFCFYEKYTTIYETIMVLDFLILLHIEKIIIEGRVDAATISVDWGPKFRSIVEENADLSRGFIQPQSQSFIKLMKMIAHEKQSIESRINSFN
jgi:hypothetical protein